MPISYAKVYLFEDSSTPGKPTKHDKQYTIEITDGSGGTVMRATAGVCYGGKEGDMADDISYIDTA